MVKSRKVRSIAGIGLAWAGAACTIATTPIAHAQSHAIEIAQFPELSPEASLPVIFKGLRRYLKEYRSISDFALCPEPQKIKMKGGKPERWTYLFSLNARNGFGGYTGLQHYAAILRADKPVTITKVSMEGDGGFDSLVNQAIEKQMAKCDFLPQARLEQLRDAE